MKNNKQIHFFKAYSRLGIINMPWGEKQLNLGVEYGPDAILSEKFISNFHPRPKITKYKFPLPENINKLDYEQTLYQSLKEFSELINKKLKNNETQVVIGGDHSVAFASVIAVLKRVKPNNMGYIQFDSHADLCTFKHSPSKNFHGMVARALLDKNFDSTLLNSLLDEKLLSTNTLYIGNLDIVKEEKDFLTKKKIQIINRSNFLNNIHSVKNRLKIFLSRFNHAHISFDVDVFDKSIVKATGTPSKFGLLKKEIYPLLSVLSEHKNISIDLVEVNPKKNDFDKTLITARDVLAKLLSD